MSFTQAWLQVDFGAGSAGLATVGFRLFKADTTDAVARTTAGVVELGQGVYGAPAVVIPDDAVGIQWDTGAAVPLYAVEAVADFVSPWDEQKADHTESGSYGVILSGPVKYTELHTEITTCKLFCTVPTHVRIACDIAIRVTKPWVPPGQL